MLRSLMIGCVAVIALLAGSGKVYAACTGNACSTVTVTLLYVSEDLEDPNNGQGKIFVGTSGTETGLTNCVPAGSSNTLLKLSIVKDAFGAVSNNYQQIYQLLLAAELSGKPVTIRTKDTPGAECDIMYVTM